MNLDVNSFFLEVDTVVALGIIINELFTNSFKYAFPAGTNGEINISLCKNPSDNLGEREHFKLIFEDNGKGFPENIDLGIRPVWVCSL